MKGRLFFTDETLKLTDVRGELFGGTITVEGDISTLKAKPGESLNVRIAGTEFSKLTKIYFGFDDFRANRPTVALKDLRSDQDRPVPDLRQSNGKIHLGSALLRLPIFMRNQTIGPSARWESRGDEG